LTAGCLPARTSTGTGEPPVAIELLRGVRWDYPHEGFDVGLPGYHLAGGVGTVALHSRTIPEEFVLEIRTTVALPPNLEGFTMQWQDTVLRVTPFAEGALAEMALVSGMQNSAPTPQMVPQNYFLFSKMEHCIEVRFLAPALRKITSRCTVSWVDWYRR
jgi:hypothetical protein